MLTAWLVRRHRSRSRDDRHRSDRSSRPDRHRSDRDRDRWGPRKPSRQACICSWSCSRLYAYHMSAARTLHAGIKALSMLCSLLSAKFLVMLCVLLSMSSEMVVCGCRRRSRSRDRMRGSEVPPPSSLYSGSRRPGREREREFRR